MNRPFDLRRIFTRAWLPAIPLLCASLAFAQFPNQRPAGPPPGAPRSTVPVPQPPGAPSAPGAAPADAGTAPAAPGRITGSIQFSGFTLQNASLTEVVDTLARQLKINYILPQKFAGSVTLNTYGDMKEVEPRKLLDLILRINGYGMVENGGVYRIVELSALSHQPMRPEMLTKDISNDDSPMLNLIFLKYITAEELAKVLEKFIGEGANIITYAPANLMFVLDSRRDMRRLMDLVSLFDDNALADQRVKLYELKNTKPTDLGKELEGVLKAIALNDKNAPIKFVPVDRINTLIVVAPNPGVFETIGKWVDKLDVLADSGSGGTDNYVYRVKYSQAQYLSAVIYGLYTGQNPFAGGYGSGGGHGGYNSNGFGGGGGGFGNSGYGNGFGGGAFGNSGAYGNGGGGAFGTTAGGQFGNSGSPYGNGGAGGTFSSAIPLSAAQQSPIQGQAGLLGNTGNFLGNGTTATGVPANIPHIIANSLDNSLLIQATPAEYKSILKLLTQIDIPPRQVLIDAKIYEVDVNDIYGGSVSTCLQLKGSATSCLGGTSPTNGGVLGAAVNTASTGAGAASLSLATFVGQSRQLLAAIQTNDTHSRAHAISTPSVIATDSIAATITVGDSVPTVTGQIASSGVSSGGTTVPYQSIQQVQTGVQLKVLARVTPAGIVTLIIDQQISSPGGSESGGSSSGSSSLTPSFSNREVSTQVTIQDGDTIALGGVIQSSITFSSSGIPFLNRIPVLGVAFGSQSRTVTRTELIVFFTPHVIYDTNSAVEASDELRGKMKTLKGVMRNDRDQ